MFIAHFDNRLVRSLTRATANQVHEESDRTQLIPRAVNTDIQNKKGYCKLGITKDIIIRILNRQDQPTAAVHDHSTQTS